MRTVVIVGIGEMGGVFARALLCTGATVVPVLRRVDPHTIAAEVAEPDLVLVAVGEDDLDQALTSLPTVWRDRAGLIQNELLPHAWQRHGIANPTVAAVWFEKKPGHDVKIVRSTPVAGAAARLVVDGLQSIGIPATEIPASELTDELVVKNLYILTSNIAGLEVGGTTGALWNDHNDLTAAVASEVLDLQEQLVGHLLDRGRLLAAMAEAFAADPDHTSTGRSAPRRLERAIRIADEAGLAVPTLRSIGRAAGIPA